MRTSLATCGVAALALPLLGPLQDTEATRLLKARGAEFAQEVIEVTDGVYTAVGFSVQPVSMIVGEDGVVIVDTGIDSGSATKVLAEFRKITPRPVRAVILTHGHGDHTGGLGVFAQGPDVQVWARENFDQESEALRSAGLVVNMVRGARQGGFLLPPEKRINNGIAQAYFPERGGAVFASDARASITHPVDEPREVREVAGLTLHLVSVTGESYDGLYVWYPAGRVLFSGDNYYKSWPNLYPIRGAPYRDVREWANTVDRMLQEEAAFLVPGHTRPVLGAEQVAGVLTDYRDAIRFVFDRTIEGMNKGLTPDELVDYVELPERFAGKDHLRPYYGHPEWAVRSIFNGYLGWFDGNPSNLFPLSPADEARRIAELAGGADVLLARAREASGSGDHQWAAQLCDHLLALEPDAKAPLEIKADALDALADDVLSGIGRNYYRTVAQELRRRAAR